MNEATTQYDEIMTAQPLNKSVYRFEMAMAVLTNLIIWLMLILMLMYSVFEPVKIEGTSMRPTLNNNDTVLINKLDFKTEGLSRGDIVVLKTDDIHIIKRVVALEGDKFAFVRNADDRTKIDLYVDYGNGFTVADEDYILEPMTRPDIFIEYDIFSDASLIESSHYTVSENHFLALGDNRNHSQDSRAYGEFPEKSVIGVDIKLIKNNSFLDKFFSFFYRDNTAKHN